MLFFECACVFRIPIIQFTCCSFKKIVFLISPSFSSLFANVIIICVPLTQKKAGERRLLSVCCHYDYYYDVDVSLTLSPLLVYIHKCFDLTPPPAFQPYAPGFTHLLHYLPSSKINKATASFSFIYSSHLISS